MWTEIGKGILVAIVALTYGWFLTGYSTETLGLAMVLCLVTE